MTAYDELFQIADRLREASLSPELEAAQQDMSALEDAASKVGRSASGSWLGYQANVYYAGFKAPPAGAHFSQEWGLKDMEFSSLGSSGDWRDYDPHEVVEAIRKRAGNPDLERITTAAHVAEELFNEAKAEIRSIILTENSDGTDVFLSQLIEDLDRLKALSTTEILEIWRPKGQTISRDMLAIGQGTKVPPHQIVKADVAAIRQAFNVCSEGSKIARKAASHLERKEKRANRSARIGTNVFIGHGRSPAWRELKDFVQDRLQLPWDEFNRVPVAGVTNQARLSEMLDAAAIALVIMTAEDETADGQMQARMNVVHEAGLFQGRLGFTKAIVLVEDGCQEFSNIQGLGQIRFPAGNVAACFEEVRRVLEREGVIES
jgi:predicted nucleotide-binding protein